jgi:hypothetical protein
VTEGSGFPAPAAETGDVGAVGALGVHGAAVEPDSHQLIVGGGLWKSKRYREGFRGCGKGDFGGHWWNFSIKE